MLGDIEAIDTVDDNFWMKTAYRIPDTPGNTVDADRYRISDGPDQQDDGALVHHERRRRTNAAAPARKRSAGSRSTAAAASRPSSSRRTAARRGARRSSEPTTGAIRSGRGRSSSRPKRGSIVRAGLPRDDATTAKRRRRSRFGIRAAICATSSRPTGACSMNGRHSYRCSRSCDPDPRRSSIDRTDHLAERRRAVQTGSGRRPRDRELPNCHSAAYVYTQPPLNRAQWTAEVIKMRRPTARRLPTATSARSSTTC